MNKQQPTTNEQKPLSDFERAYQTLKHDERYANMARACGVTPANVEAKTSVESNESEGKH